MLLTSHAFCVEVAVKAKEFTHSASQTFERLRSLVLKSCEQAFPYESVLLRATGALVTFLWNGANVLGYSLPLELSAQLTRIIQFFPASLLQKSMMLLCAPAAEALMTHLQGTKPGSLTTDKTSEPPQIVQLAKAWVDAVRLAVPEAEVDVSLTRLRALLASALRFGDESSILAQRALRTDNSAISISVLLYVSNHCSSDHTAAAMSAVQTCTTFLSSPTTFSDKMLVVKALCWATPNAAEYLTTLFTSAVAVVNREPEQATWPFSHKVGLEHLLESFSLTLSSMDRADVVLDLFRTLKPVVEALVERNGVDAGVAASACDRLSRLATLAAEGSDYAMAAGLWEANLFFAAFLPETLSKRETARVTRCLCLAYLSVDPPDLARAERAISSSLTLDPTSQHGLFLRVRLNLSRRDESAAQAALEPLIACHPPPSAELLAEIAQDAFAVGNVTVCIDALKAALPDMRSGLCDAQLASDLLHNMAVVVLSKQDWKADEESSRVLMECFRIASSLSLTESEGDWWWSIGWNIACSGTSTRKDSNRAFQTDLIHDVVRILGGDNFAARPNPPYRQASALFMGVSRAVESTPGRPSYVVESLIAQLATLEALAFELSTSQSMNRSDTISLELRAIVCSPRFPFLVGLLRLITEPTNGTVLERILSSPAASVSDLEAVAARLTAAAHQGVQRAILRKALDLIAIDTSAFDETNRAQQCSRIVHALLRCGEKGGLEDAAHIVAVIKQVGKFFPRRDVQDIAAHFWNVGVTYMSTYMPMAAKPWLQCGLNIAGCTYPPLEIVDSMAEQIKLCEQSDASDPCFKVFGSTMMTG